MKTPLLVAPTIEPTPKSPGPDGISPISLEMCIRDRAGLILSGNTLYGTTSQGGTNAVGTVFAISTNGTGFADLYSFTAPTGPDSTNGDGADPEAALFLSGSTLYGTAEYGGTNGYGTLFAVGTNGTGFTDLYNFTDGNDGSAPCLLYTSRCV